MQKEVAAAVADPHHPAPLLDPHHQAPLPDPHLQGHQARPGVHAAAHQEDHRQAVDL